MQAGLFPVFAVISLNMIGRGVGTIAVIYAGTFIVIGPVILYLIRRSCRYVLAGRSNQRQDHNLFAAELVRVAAGGHPASCIVRLFDCRLIHDEDGRLCRRLWLVAKIGRQGRQVTMVARSCGLLDRVRASGHDDA